MMTCTTCQETKADEHFGIDKRRKNRRGQCQACRTIAQRAWRKSRPDYEKVRYQAVKTDTRERHLVRKYGVDLVAYNAMLTAQDGKCAICRAPEAAQHKGVFHVDHDHATGKVRGLLCRGCNHMLGVAGDDPALLLRAVEYLVPALAAEIIGAYLDARTEAPRHD